MRTFSGVLAGMLSGRCVLPSMPSALISGLLLLISLYGISCAKRSVPTASPIRAKCTALSHNDSCAYYLTLTHDCSGGVPIHFPTANGGGGDTFWDRTRDRERMNQVERDFVVLKADHSRRLGRLEGRFNGTPYPQGALSPRTPPSPDQGLTAAASSADGRESKLNLRSLPGAESSSEPHRGAAQGATSRRPAARPPWTPRDERAEEYHETILLNQVYSLIVSNIKHRTIH